MRTIDLGARWNRLFKEHDRAQMLCGLGTWIVVIGIPLSVTFLPTTPAAVIATVLAIIGMGIGFHSAELENDHEKHCEELSQLHAWLYDHDAPTENPVTTRSDDQS